MPAQQPQTVAEYREAVDGLAEAVLAEPRGPVKTLPPIISAAPVTPELPDSVVSPAPAEVVKSPSNKRHRSV